MSPTAIRAEPAYLYTAISAYDMCTISNTLFGPAEGLTLQAHKEKNSKAISDEV